MVDSEECQGEWGVEYFLAKKAGTTKIKITYKDGTEETYKAVVDENLNIEITKI